MGNDRMNDHWSQLMGNPHIIVPADVGWRTCLACFRYLSATLPGGRRPDQKPIPMARFSWPTKLSSRLRASTGFETFSALPRNRRIQSLEFKDNYVGSTRWFCQLWTSTSPQGPRTSSCDSRGMAGLHYLRRRDTPLLSRRRGKAGVGRESHHVQK